MLEIGQQRIEPAGKMVIPRGWGNSAFATAFIVRGGSFVHNDPSGKMCTKVIAERARSGGFRLASFVTSRPIGG